MPDTHLTLESLINDIDAELPDSGPLDRLSRARERARGMTDLGDLLVDHYVGLARAGGASWAQIGDAMGVSKQAAQQRRTPAMFNRFTDRARNVLVAAQERARTRSRPEIDTEHLLLGLLDETGGLAASILASLGGSAGQVADAVLAASPTGPAAPDGQIPLTEASKRVLTESVAAAAELGHNFVGTEHLLLGLTRVPGGVAPTVLAELGIDQRRATDVVSAALIGFQHRAKH